MAYQNLTQISQSDIQTNGVVSAPTVLTGTEAENKYVFDKLEAEVVIPKVNALIDRSNGVISTKETTWDGHYISASLPDAAAQLAGKLYMVGNEIYKCELIDSNYLWVRQSTEITSLTESDDLNECVASHLGTMYYMYSGSNAPLHAPQNGQFIMSVTNVYGASGLFIQAIDYADKQYRRTYSEANDVWATWQEIYSSANLPDDVPSRGVTWDGYELSGYFLPDADVTLENKLYMASGEIYKCQRQEDEYIWVRQTMGISTLSNDSDLNDCRPTGFNTKYYTYSGEEAPVRAPQNGRFILSVISVRCGGDVWFVQTIEYTDKQYRRTGVDFGAIWTQWQEVYTSTNKPDDVTSRGDTWDGYVIAAALPDADAELADKLYMVDNVVYKCTLIDSIYLWVRQSAEIMSLADSDDLNECTESYLGTTYYMYSGSTAPLHAPQNGQFIMITTNVYGASGLVIQVIDYADKQYRRTFSEANDVWTTWQTTATLSDINSCEQKAEITKTTDVANVEITLGDNSIFRLADASYVYQGIADIELLLPQTAANDAITEIEFRSGSTATTLVYPQSILFSGDDVTQGVFIPAANRLYTLILWYNGNSWQGTARGV